MTNERYHKIGFGLVGFSLCILTFSKALSSVAMLLLALWWLFGGSYKEKVATIINNKLALGFLLYFIITSLGYFYTSDQSFVQKHIQHKSIFLLGGIAVPFIIFNPSHFNTFLKCFVVSTVLASLYCLFAATYHYLPSHDSSVFFYHALLLPLKLHAVYFSIAVYLCLVFLAQQILLLAPQSNKWMYYVGFVFFSIILVLLSSKLILALYTLTILVLGFANLKKSKSFALIAGCTLIGLCLVLFTGNDVSKRFYDLRLNVNDALHKKMYGDNVYLDGLTFRILTARYGAEIISENKAWLFGVSSGNSQRLLTEKMQEAKLYSGYYQYNFHNQFIETYVQCGLLGLICLLFIFTTLIYQAVKSRHLLFSAFVIAFIAFAFTESFLERQYGTFPFILLSLFFIKLSLTHTNNTDAIGNSYKSYK